jgi:hypothetical protein
MKPQIRKPSFKRYITVTHSPLYGIHIQAGRWLVGRETQNFHDFTKETRRRLREESSK